jgi:hypothetical protein
MSLEELRSALDTLEEASCCSGKHELGERLAIALPDGDVGAVDDASFVEWLLEHSEPAPYGHGTETKLDPKVRSAQRVKARDQAAVHGFDPAAILGEIEAVLSPTRKLSARLTDVITYKKGDKFTRHKDTPRSADLVGTLIVGLPIAHTGGTFVIDDGRGEQTFDWSGKPAPGVVPWVALFTDVDHEIKPVKSGARVTLVYALHRTGEPRSDAGAKQRQGIVKKAATALGRQSKWPVLIPCGRHVIAEPNSEQPQSIECLRGADRDIAEALEEAGFHVDVRACIAAIPNYEDPQPWPATTNMFAITRLNAVPPVEIREFLGDEVSGIEEFILDDVMLEQCAIRKSAAAMLLHENGMWALDGMAFGNEGFDALLYSLAALEVSKPTGKAKAKSKAPSPMDFAAAISSAKPKAKAQSKPKAKAKPAAKAKPKAKPKKKKKR